MKKCCRILTGLFVLGVLVFSCSKDGNNPPPSPPVPPPPVTPADSSLIGYYAFSGTAKDSSVYGHDGSLSNAELTRDRFGVANKAYAFNGTNSYIRLPGATLFDHNGSISILAWVNPQVICGPGGGCYLVWRGDGQGAHDPYALYFNSNGVGIRKDVGDGTTVNQVLTPMDNSYLNIWTHIAGTYDAATHTGRVYINGVLAKEQVFGSSMTTYATSGFLTNIGSATLGDSNEPFGAFKGAIDEVRIYKRVLTAGEIAPLAK
jgi:hypothetical protein